MFEGPSATILYDVASSESGSYTGQISVDKAVGPACTSSVWEARGQDRGVRPECKLNFKNSAIVLNRVIVQNRTGNEIN